MPQFACFHWDGKLVSDHLGVISNRLAVFISGGPQYFEGNLLGVPVIKDSTGS